MRGKNVALVNPYERRSGVRRVECDSARGLVTYQVVRSVEESHRRGEEPFDVVIHDGYIPPKACCRVISTSEIF